MKRFLKRMLVGALAFGISASLYWIVDKVFTFQQIRLAFSAVLISCIIYFVGWSVDEYTSKFGDRDRPEKF